jgi:hypothetical protein
MFPLNVYLIVHSDFLLGAAPLILKLSIGNHCDPVPSSASSDPHNKFPQITRTVFLPSSSHTSCYSFVDYYSLGLNP